MAHFAKLDDNNVVVSVHVVNNDVLQNLPFPDSESVGVQFLSNLHSHPNWKQTSYNATFRKNYAGIGHTYRADIDAFVAPQPYASWTLNVETARWEPPVAMPTDGGMYLWDEDSQQWVEVQNGA